MPASEDTADRVHDNVVDWAVHAEDTEGDYEAVVGKTTVTARNAFDGKPVAEVFVFISLDDGAVVVHIDTHHEREVPVRVETNAAVRPVLDETITP